MTTPVRVVFDTNVLVSAALTAGGTPRRAVEYVLMSGLPLLSAATYDELAEVLDRPRFRPYLPERIKTRFLDRLTAAAVWVEAGERIEACRDPKDDPFLEAAVSGRADVLVSGDADLLVLHPFRGIPVLTPAAFLERMETAL